MANLFHISNIPQSPCLRYMENGISVCDSCHILTSVYGPAQSRIPSDASPVPLHSPRFGFNGPVTSGTSSCSSRSSIGMRFLLSIGDGVLLARCKERA